MRRINPGFISLFDGFNGGVDQSRGIDGFPPGRTNPPCVGGGTSSSSTASAYFFHSTALSEFWQAGALYQSSSEIPVTPGGRPIFRAWNGSQQRWELKWHTDNGGRLQLFKNGVLQATSTASHALVSGMHKHFEWHVKHANSGGIIEVWVDGLQLSEMTISGNTKDSQPDITFSDYCFANDAVGRGYYLSDCVLTDEGRIKNASLKILYPNAAGDINQWSGSYADIDEFPIGTFSPNENDGDTTYSAATTTGLKRLENVEDLAVEATIISVSVATFMRQFVAGSPAFSHTALIRRNGLDYEQIGTPNAQMQYSSQATAIIQPQQILTWATDPAGGAWSKNKINGAFQIGSKS